MITIKEGTKFYEGFRYIRPAIGRTDYKFWRTQKVPAYSPAWAMNGPPPPIERVIQDGLFCAAVPNLMLRKVGKRIPIRNDRTDFDGGVAAYFGDNMFGPGYFADEMEDFNLRKAKQWAEEARSGVLIGRRFTWTQSGQVASEGHVAILLPSGYVLQAVPYTGLNWNLTIEQSHDNTRFQVMVPPRKWINFEGKEF